MLQMQIKLWSPNMLCVAFFFFRECHCGIQIIMNPKLFS